MAKGIKTGGRKKGSKNKRSWDARVLADKLGVDPLEVLLNFAKRDWEALGYKSPEFVVGYSKDGDPITEEVCNPNRQLNAARDASKYLYSQLKSIEHSGKDGEPIQFNDQDAAAKLLMILNAVKKRAPKKK